MLDERLKNVAVLGAAGKMGSGIALLLLEQMMQTAGTDGAKDYNLYLIDTNPQALEGLKEYLHTQYEKRVGSNVAEALSCVHFETDLEKAADASLIFEAIIEDVDIKTEVFSTLKAIGRPDAFYFSNTSSIPISILNEKSDLGNRIIGYHFFNPPAVQRLLEIISYDGIDPNLVQVADELAQRLNKIVVHSKDVAGFIGNGHFMREISFACQKVKELGTPDAIALINHVTQVLLVRPMGIFQLVDYVGLDVGQKVTGIMSTYLQEEFETGVIDQMAAEGNIGGQHPDGSQKRGFFKYVGHIPVDVYSFEKRDYVSYPHHADPWKERRKTLPDFERLRKGETLEDRLAQEFLDNSRKIAEKLVKDGVAKSLEDVDTVLINGFYHLYGVQNLSQKV